MWDSVPWMVGGGVKHSTNVARLLAYAAFGGQEGIIGTLDLEVRERAVPDGTVRIAPGACAILNRNENVAYDAYAARLPTEDVVAIPATGSGGWRTDLIVARIENPFLTGEPFAEPSAADIAAGSVQFVRTHVYPAILSGNAGAAQHPSLAQIKAAIGTDSAIPLASVALPASTGTVAQGYIKDQRAMAQFREAQVKRVVNPGTTVVINGAPYKDLGSTVISVPEWATHFSATAIVGGASHGAGDAVGTVRLALGDVTTETTGYNDQSTNSDRFVLMAGATKVALPASHRGTDRTLRVQANKTSGVDTSVGSASAVALDVVFHTQPEHNTAP